jgi:hypothetical protein
VGKLHAAAEVIAMFANTTTTPRSPAPSPAENWLHRVLHAVRHVAAPQKPDCEAAQPLTRRQMLLMAQDQKRAEERARCAELARIAKQQKQPG